VLPLFTCLIDRVESPDGGYYVATCAAFPKLQGTGRTSEQARESLARFVLNFYGAARERGLMVEV
jgi:hypothetical protein